MLNFDKTHDPTNASTLTADEYGIIFIHAEALVVLRGLLQWDGHDFGTAISAFLLRNSRKSLSG